MTARDYLDAAINVETAPLHAEIARLRAALELIAAPMRPDGTYNRDRTACGIVASEALKGAAK